MLSGTRYMEVRVPSFEAGKRVQILVAKYRSDDTCETTSHPGPTGAMFGYYGPHILVELDEGYFADLKDGTKVYHSVVVVHEDNLVEL